MLDDGQLIYIYIRIYIYKYKSSEFKQTPNYKLQNHLWAHTLKKKTKPQIKQQKQKKEEDRKTWCITDTFVLVTAQNKKHLDQKNH